LGKPKRLAPPTESVISLLEGSREGLKIPSDSPLEREVGDIFITHPTLSYLKRGNRIIGPVGGKKFDNK
jgi:hypothetical protein